MLLLYTFVYLLYLLINKFINIYINGTFLNQYSLNKVRRVTH